MNWRLLEAAMDAAQTAAWGERVRISFMQGGKLDNTRNQVIVNAILHTGGDDSRGTSGGDRGEAFRTRLSSGEAELFIEGATYAGPTIKQGDRIRAIERRGEPIWEISGVSDRYSSQIVLSLNEI